MAATQFVTATARKAVCGPMSSAQVAGRYPGAMAAARASAASVPPELFEYPDGAVVSQDVAEVAAWSSENSGARTPVVAPLPDRASRCIDRESRGKGLPRFPPCMLSLELPRLMRPPESASYRWR